MAGALSLLTQNSSFLDLHALFDSQQQQEQQQELIQQQEQQQEARIIPKREYSIGSESNQMDLNNLQNPFQQQNISNGSSNNNNFNNKLSGSTISINQNLQKSGNIIQGASNTNKNCLTNFHHYIGPDFTQVNYFVDSPPISEESWTDEHSKGSPGPVIIDVQTLSTNIYNNSGSRKRRMDWDSLEIVQSENTPATQSGELTNKLQNQEKEKHKREKLNERGNWTDDIGFDLNTEFNTNPYLSNESFLSFSPTLTVLKQEPQSNNQPIKINKATLIPQPGRDQQKTDKPTTSIAESTVHSSQEKPTKNDLNENICGCGTQGFEHNSTTVDQVNKNANENGNVGGNIQQQQQQQQQQGQSQSQSHQNQQISVIETKKIDNGGSKIAASHADDNKFQYILAAATSIATKNNEETLTYLNQGQSYEIKLKKIGDLSFYRDKILKSVIKICFHERRLQFMEREQMQQWQASRPGERIIEVDVPLSYGLCHVLQPMNQNYLNTVEVFWDPMKEVGVYIKVNCISTEFTPKKHGGEKGVPFRLQIETYIENTNTPSTSSTTAAAAAAVAVAVSPVAALPAQNPASSPSPITLANASPGRSVGSGGMPTGTLTPPSHNVNNLIGGKQPVHAAACQIKVFKLKGADRKHKQDREKIQRRTQLEQEKFQPSYECTIMNDILLDLITPSTGCFSPEYMKIWPKSPVHIPKYDGGILSYGNASPVANSSPIAINSVTSTNSSSLKLMDANMVSPSQVSADVDEYTFNIMPESTPAQVTQWLTSNRLTAYLSTFAHFSGSDIMRMSKEDLIQICGLADGIRMFNILRAKAITPRLTIYVSLDGSSYNAIYLISNTSKELTQKFFKLPGFFELIAKSSNGGILESGPLYTSWGMPSKYSGSGSNIFNDVSKTFIYMTGPSGVHVTVTDEVMNNEIKDGSLYVLEAQNGKIIMKLVNKNEN